MAYEYFIARRYFRSPRKAAFISVITLFSVAAVTIGVMTLIVVIAVMTGAEAELKKQILGTQSHIVAVYRGAPFTDYRVTIDDIQTIDGVKQATPYLMKQVVLRSKTGQSGAIIKGLQPALLEKVLARFGRQSLPPDQAPPADKTERSLVPRIYLGKALAAGLKLATGDIVFLMSGQNFSASRMQVPRVNRLMIAGLIDSGLHDHDVTFAYLDLNDAQTLLNIGDSVTGIEIQANHIDDSPDLAKKIGEKLGFSFWVVDWMQRNRNIFSALKLQKTVMFVIFLFIVLVAGFGITSSLIMMVMTKTKDIAILKALGATDRSIRKIFLFRGTTIGATGTALGIGLGYILCELLKRYQFVDLPEDVYFFTTLPVQLAVEDVLVISLAAMVICFIASIYPANQAARFKPVDGLRYD